MYINKSLNFPNKLKIFCEVKKLNKDKSCQITLNVKLQPKKK